MAPPIDSEGPSKRQKFEPSNGHGDDTDQGEPKAFYGLPAHVKYCSKCVISNQRPNSCQEFRHTKDSKKTAIAFDESNVCDACLFNQKKHDTIDWKAREEELKTLLDKYRSTDGSFDCVVPGSGGKDSFMTAHLLKFKYGMHPLTVTWAPHVYTEVGFRNFQHWLHAGFDNMLYTPNGKVHRKLTQLAVKNLLHPFQPFILGQKNLAPRMALMHKIPLVFYGENEAEYGNPQKDTETARRAVEFYTASDPMELTLGGVSVRELISAHGLDVADLQPYMPVDPRKTQDLGMELQYLGYYVPWDPQEAYYYSVNHGNFEANPERTEGTYSKYNSLDDRIDGFHYFTTWIKFGLGRASYDAAQEVRNRKITREEAVALVRKFDGEFPTKYFDEILEYLDMTAKEFFDVVDTFRSPHLWRKLEDGNWEMRTTVYGEAKLDDSRKYAAKGAKYPTNKKLIDYVPLD